MAKFIKVILVAIASNLTYSPLSNCCYISLYLRLPMMCTIYTTGGNLIGV